MRKKYQVFVSSTYLDLKEDRQMAVEAILAAGHIPAGMELFAAGSESQLSIIKRWIDESDIYMLILGGRYGSIEPKTGKSYIQLEYEYALSQNKPLFSVVMSDNLIEKRVKDFGTQVIERQNIEGYNQFKTLVLSKMCRFYNDKKDIKIYVLESLNDIQNRLRLSGWISGRDFPFENIEQCKALLNSREELVAINARLLHENNELRIKLTQWEEKKSIDKKSKNVIIKQDSLDIRIDRILKLLYYRESNDLVTWEEGPEKKSITHKFNNITEEFQPFFVSGEKDEVNFDCIAFIHIDSDLGTLNLNSLFGEIRLQMEKFPNKTDLEFKFIIASLRIEEEIRERCYKQFKYIRECSKIPDKVIISLEIWDKEKIELIEKELGLSFIL